MRQSWANAATYAATMASAMCVRQLNVYDMHAHHSKQKTQDTHNMQRCLEGLRRAEIHTPLADNDTKQNQTQQLIAGGRRLVGRRPDN